MNDGNHALDSPRDLYPNLNEVHRDTADSNGNVARLASFDAPFTRGCEGCHVHE